MNMSVQNLLFNLPEVGCMKVWRSSLSHVLLGNFTDVCIWLVIVQKDRPSRGSCIHVDYLFIYIDHHVLSPFWLLITYHLAWVKTHGCRQMHQDWWLGLLVNLHLQVEQSSLQRCEHWICLTWLQVMYTQCNDVILKSDRYTQVITKTKVTN